MGNGLGVGMRMRLGDQLETTEVAQEREDGDLTRDGFWIRQS